MLKRERQAYILHQVNLHNKVLAVNLCQDVSVSDDTIRRDLQELAEEGKIIKVHGGALSKSFHKSNPAAEQVYSYVKKGIIAQKAVKLVKDGMFVLTSGGTTIIELAKALPENLHATFISGSISALAEYVQHPTIDVIAIGDKISKNSKITIGPDAISQIRQVKSDLCFLGINAIDTEFGISDNDWDVVQMKKAMIESSKKVICLTISEKINSLQPIKVCPLKKIDMLITELPADDPLLRPYVEAGVTVL
ncbi:MAG TPA: DeoR/GlpR family DNA-binding transcription regulator [Chitinophagaceae bacterium]|nr:DeoR/GlpR family DNA-binding transcription regulator [Chitinophagaceae bacterium]